jgi:adenine C2-methylase RlmN of 23S rRNA A2503 and tRNA A37
LYDELSDLLQQLSFSEYSIYFFSFLPLFSIHDEDKILTLFEQNGHKKFRYAQLENALYKNLLTDFSLMETLPKDIRDLLSENCFYSSLTLHSEKTDPE